MDSSNKKPRSVKGLAARTDQGSNTTSNSLDNESHDARITRLGLLKQRAKDQEQYIFDYVEQVEGDTDFGKFLGYYANRMAACGHYLLFRNYYQLGETKLVKAHTCQIHLLCPLCAHNRAAKSVRAYVDRFEVIRKAKPRLKPVLITLTVKNGEDLNERFEHLKSAFKNLMDRRRDWKKKARGHVEFCKIQGAVYSYEVTKNDTGWHPHLHMFALLDDWIDQDMLSAEWLEATGDSMIVDVRRVRPKTQMINGQQISGHAKAFCEVFKYAMKFSDMSHLDTLAAFITLRGKRLTGSIGCFRGVVVPKGLEDVIDVKDQPYLELLYKFKTNAGYTLAAVQAVDPDPELEGWRRSDATDDRETTQVLDHKSQVTKSHAIFEQVTKSQVTSEEITGKQLNLYTHQSLNLCTSKPIYI